MKTFCLSKQLDTLYQRYPEGQHRPVVGITANVEGDDYTLRQVYCQQIVAAGGVPLIIPAVADADVICSTLDSIDALLLTGGADLNPLWTNEEPAPTLGHINATCPSCSSPAWPTTVACPSWAYAEACRCSP